VCFKFIITRLLLFIIPLIYSMAQDIRIKGKDKSCSGYYLKIRLSLSLSKISYFLMESKVSLPCSHKPTTGSYPQPAESSSPIDSCLPKVHLNVILPPTPMSSQWCLAFGPPNQNPVNTSPLPRACHMTHPPHSP
jgi:hypothetical protein